MDVAKVAQVTAISYLFLLPLLLTSSTNDFCLSIQSTEASQGSLRYRVCLMSYEYIVMLWTLHVEFCCFRAGWGYLILK